MGRGDAVGFIHFEKTADCSYPIGEKFNDNFDYIREAARTLHTVVDKDKDIALVCRGTSGCIIAGAVGYILKKKGRKVTIVISRKSENTHGDNMDGYYRILVDGAVPVVIDDFISCGDTIGKILKDLDNLIKWDTYPFLCTANFLDNSKVNKEKETYGIFYEVINRFDTMICNKP